MKIKCESEDSLEFTGKPKEQEALAVKSYLQYKVREDRIDFNVNGTVGLTGVGVFTVVGWCLLIVIGGILMAIYYEHVLKKVVDSAFEQLFASLYFDLS